jgi:hypothetical protein
MTAAIKKVNDNRKASDEYSSTYTMVERYREIEEERRKVGVRVMGLRSTATNLPTLLLYTSIWHV